MPDRYVIGVEAAFEYIQAGLIKVGAETAVVHKFRFEQRAVTLSPNNNLIMRITTAISQLMDTAPAVGVKVTYGDLDAIGIAVPGLIDENNEILVSSHHLQIDRLPLAQEISRRCSNVRTKIVNDAMACAIAEHQHGAAKGYQNAVYILVGWGIGSATIINNRPYGGASNRSGEFGHVKIAADGAVCACGSQGCVQATSSREAVASRILAHARRNWDTKMDWPSKPEEIDSQILQRAIEQKDDLATLIIEEAAMALARGFATVINLIAPNVIVLGGDFIKGVPRLRDVAVMWARHNALQGIITEVTFADAQLDPDAQLIGASHLAKQSTGRNALRSVSQADAG